MTIPSILAVGFLLGMTHATDADHLAAVTSIVSQVPSRRVALRIGAFWGLGHSITILAVGGAIVVGGLVVPPRLAMSLELLVALMLIGLGVANVMRGSVSSDLGSHPPLVAPESGCLAAPGGHEARWRALRTLCVGVVHGLAGSAPVALLVMTTQRGPGWSILYLLTFGLGTVLGMMLATASVAVPMEMVARRSSTSARGLIRGTGIVSLALGVFLVHRLSVVEGLFTRLTTSVHP